MTGSSRDQDQDGAHVVEQGVAPRLLSPPTELAVRAPPNRGPLHDLPLGELSWENFERLAWRLVALRGEVRQTTLYGNPGQKQHGIDLLAELRTGERAVFQCKRKATMSRGDIQQAVDRFLEGEWSTSAKVFGLFTRISLREAKLADEVTTQTQRLHELGILFERLDLDEISLRCKEAADVVWDFFGEGWATAFCSPHRTAALGGRLRPEEAEKLRRDLREFYLRSFSENDFLPPPISQHPPTGLSERFVPVEVLEVRVNPRTAREDRSALPRSVREEHRRDTLWTAARGEQEHLETAEARAEVRQPLWDWLAGGTCSVLTGAGGQGKSTILRVLACDLLAEEPSPGILASKWPGFVPLWVPFPSWAERLARDDSDIDLRGAIREWLGARGQHHLLRLVDRALDDGRVILLVDGLDEYASDESAMAAFQRLLVEQGQRGLPIIAAGRPGPTFRLRPGLDGIRHATLAPLTEEQQHGLVANRLTADSANTPTRAENAKAETERFFQELARAPAAVRFSDSPLLLSMMLRVWMEDGGLPDGRSQLLKRVVAVLIADHSSRRRVASGVRRPANLPEDNEIAEALAALAYRIRLRGFSIALYEAEAALRDHAADSERGLGMPKSEARKTARALVIWLRDHLDILEQEGDRLALRHRMLLEYLTAAHLAVQGSDQRDQAVRMHAADPGWQEVWPDLIAMLDTAVDALSLFDGLRQQRAESPVDFHLDVALTTAAVGVGALPYPNRIYWLSHIQSSVRTCSWWPHKAELVGLVTRGLLHPGVADAVESILTTWIPRRHEWPSALVGAVAKWPQAPDIITELVQVVRDHDDIHARLRAARTIARMGPPSPPISLVQIVREHTDCQSVASAWVALAEAWPNSPEARALAPTAASCGCRELKLAIWFLELNQGRRPEVPLRSIALTNNRRLDLAFHGLLLDVLARSWLGERETRDTLLELARSGRNSSWGQLDDDTEVDLAFVRRVLISGFPADDSVAAYIAELLDSDSSWHDCDQVLLDLQRGFRRHQKLADAVDRWLGRSSVHLARERALAALVSGTNLAKNAMLVDLSQGSLPWWPVHALIEGWTLTDPQVRKAVESFVTSSPEAATSLAHYLRLFEPDASMLRDVVARAK
jgi:hypothetical protein